MKTLRWLLAATLAVAGAAAPLAAQARGTVTGRVVDAASQRPVAGANVRVAGSPIGVQSDEEGRFTLRNVPQGARTIQATRIGYQQGTASTTVSTGTSDVTIRLASDPLGLEGIVAIGYGEQSRRNVTGAIGSIRPSETVESTPTAQVDQILQGRVSGVQVTQNSGVPGSAITVRIRGASSISAGNDPLYVIDGVPLIQGNYSGFNGTQGGQDIDALADLNPNDIESMEILKDASAAAIYGSRASNGVVLITTKKGRAGTRPQIEFNTYYGTQSAWRIPGMLTTEQYIDVYNDAYRNDGYDIPGSRLRGFGVQTVNQFGYDDDAVPNCTAVSATNRAPVCDEDELPRVETDWLRTVLRSAPISSLSGSIGGGSERARYFVTGSRFQQDGIVEGFGYERLAGRVNLDYSASDRLQLGTNVALTRGLTDRTRGDNTIYGPFANAIASAPWDRVFDEEGEYNLDTFIYENPVALARENVAEERSFHVLGNAFASYRLLEGLNARFTVGLDNYDLRSSIYDSPIVGPYTGSNGRGGVANANAIKVLTEGTLSFNRDIGRNTVSSVLGLSYEDNTLNTDFVQGEQLPGTAFRQVVSAAVITGGEGDISSNTLASAFGRLSNTFAEKLTVTLNARVDGSSRFGENNRWGVFPSAAVQYRLGEEPFLRDVSAISDLSLRASYGRTGNQEGLGNFASRGLFTGGANYGDRPGISPSQLPNADLSWEKTDQLNVGLDLGLFDNRVGVTLDAYTKNTTDLLLTRPIPYTTGFALFTENIGELRNEGLELTLRGDLFRNSGRGFSWRSELNVSTNRNEVTKLYRGEPINQGIDDISRIEEGQPLGSFYGWQMLGIFQTEDEVAAHAEQDGALPGDVKFRDVNGDGVVNASDKMVIGSPWPDYQGGWTNTMSFRGFDLNLFAQFSVGNEIYNAVRSYSDAYGSAYDNHSTRALKRWTQENPSTTEPRSTTDNTNDNARVSSRFLEDGSYVRLKNAVLGYTFGERLARRVGTRSVRVYVQGQNLLTSTNYSGFDPEVNYAGSTGVVRGVDFYTLPQARTYTFGLNFGF
jgi:TonB-linked SusC/RagA family outer membrane protein